MTSRKVVVFGGSGFLGSHVADVLTDSGYAVTVFDQERSRYLKKGQLMVVGSILDGAAVDRVVKGAWAVYHFAGIAGIEDARSRPLAGIETNILGTARILDACRKHKVMRFLFASSLYVYSKMGSFYRATKQSCELLTETYREAYGLPYTILRYGSLYGPRAGKESFIRTVIGQALSKGEIVRGGDGEEIREYIHVLDAARSSVDVLGKEYANKSVVITGLQPMKIKDLLLMIREIFNNQIKVRYVAPTNHEHYEITPYSFEPKPARRITHREYLDLGQGLLSYIREIYDEAGGKNGNPAAPGAVVKAAARLKSKARR